MKLSTILVAGLSSVALVACSGEQGTQGAAGAAGEKGDPGDKGDPGSPGGPGGKGDPGDPGGKGDPGDPGAPGVSTGDLTGTVTNATTGEALADVAVAITPDVLDDDVVTGADGTFSATLPAGVYDVSIAADGYTAMMGQVSLLAGVGAMFDAALVPAAAVTVSVASPDATEPGGSAELSATVMAYDGSNVTGYAWTQTGGVDTQLADAATDTLTVTLPAMQAYRDALVEHLEAKNRFGVLGINPFALEETEAMSFQVTVTTTTGTYKANGSVMAHLPYAISTGLETIGIGTPVVLSGAEQADYDWTLTPPANSNAALDASDVRIPSFTPDLAGEYEITEAGGAAFSVFAGTFAGAISGRGADGMPDADSCTMCHNGIGAPDQFTDWRASGHAEILTQNIENPAGHWSFGCASCHSVGYDLAADNGGFDEAVEDDEWEPPHPPGPGAFDDMLADADNAARLANIQCENCHGPNNGTGQHNDQVTGGPRTSFSSELCASCHGEPKRHARYQQWQLSGHSNFELAESESGNSCAPCHTAQGFAAATANLDTYPALPAGFALTEEEAQPQTCVACHDPHAQGKTSGEPNTATVRVTGDTPMLMAGFKARGVGRGAVCMTCHNSRRGGPESNDRSGGRAPHGPAQADILMGQNAWFVAADRSPHSFLADTCTTCHMNKTDPPAAYSNNLSGTNHTFSASFDICADCHGELGGDAFEAGFEQQIDDLAMGLGSGIAGAINDAGSVWVAAAMESGTGASSSAGFAVDTAANPVVGVEVTSYHGRLALLVTLTDPVSVTWAVAGGGTAVRPASEFTFEVRRLLAADGGAQFFADDSNAVRGAWNLSLIRNDGSKGAHNPGYVAAMIDATLAMDLSN